MKCLFNTRCSFPSLFRPVILVFIFSMTALASQSYAQTTVLPAPWMRDWNAARQIADREKLPMLAMFSAEWSPPCEESLTQLLTIKDVQDRLMTNWVTVFVDEAQFPDLHKRYKIRALPTFIVFNLKGDEHTRFVGSREPDDFLDKLSEAWESMVALDQIQRALDKEPHNPYLYKTYGDLLLDLGRFEAAEDAYKKARKYDPDNKTGARADLLFLDALKKANTDPEDCLRMFDQLARMYPASARVGDSIFITAMIELDHFKNNQRAQMLLEQYVKYHPQGRFADIAKDQLKTLRDRR